MLWKKKKKKVHIRIEFEKETEEILIVCEPKGTGPVELIQILLYAMKTIDMALKQERGEAPHSKEKKKKSLNYIG